MKLTDWVSVNYYGDWLTVFQVQENCVLYHVSV